VRAGQIKGEVWYGVPLVGYASVWLAGGWGGMLVDLTAVGLLLYAGWFIAAGIRERRRTVDVCDQAGLVSDGSHEREQVGV
jgi:signal peptidase